MKLAAVLLVLMLSAPAMAGSITFSEPFYNHLPLPTLPSFDPTLGQLTQVDVDIQTNASGFWWSGDGTLFDAGTFNLLFQVSVRGSYVGLSQTVDPFILDAPTIVSPWQKAFEMQATITDDLERFQGPSVNLAYDCWGWVADASSPIVVEVSSVIGTETVTYTFGTFGLASIPEPSSVVMLVMGVAGMGLVIKRKTPARARAMKG